MPQNSFPASQRPDYLPQPAPRSNFQSGGAIPVTAWTLVDQAGVGQPEAISRFLSLYRRALVTHAVIRFHVQSDDAEDLVQNFILDKIITQNLIAAVNRNLGRFRNFLLTALDNFIRQHRRSMAALKRRPDAAGSLDDRFDAPSDSPPDDSFDIQWARDLLAHAIEQMKAECVASGQDRIFEVFRCRLLAPSVDAMPPMPYEQMVTQFCFQSPIQAANALVTAKRMFDRHLRSAIREYVQADSQIDQEIQELFHVLSQAR